MLLRFLTVFAVLLAAAPCAGAGYEHPGLVQAGKEFDSMHDSAASGNLPGVCFMLRTIDGRTRFQCGERIQVQFVISSYLKNTYHSDQGADKRYGWNTDGFVCDFLSGALDPQISSYLQDNSLVVGNWLEAMPDYLNSPRVDTLDLNEWIAFDKPGTYRLYTITHRIHRTDKKGMVVPAEEGPEEGPPTTSTVLTLTITPTEKAWEQGVIAQALAPYHGPWDEVMDSRVALLHYLRTKDAAVALLHEMESDHTYQFAQDRDWYEGECSEDLLESPHRDEMIPLMEQEIADPDVPITENFLDTYSILLYYRAYPNQTASSQAGHSDFWKHALSLLQQALPAKRGAAKAISSQTAKTFDTSGLDHIIAREQGG